MQTTIKIAENEANRIQNWLDQNEPHPSYGECETIRRYVVPFIDEPDIEVEIKICNSDSGPYVDAIMFEAGCEIGFLEPRNTFLGVYDFRDEQDFYRVIVEKAA